MRRNGRLLGLTAVVVALAALAAALLAASGDEDPARRGARPNTTATATPDGTVAARARPRTAGAVAGRLEAERLAAQLMLVGFEGTELSAAFFERLSAVDYGGVLFEERNFTSLDQFAALVGEVGVVARNADHLPPLVAVGRDLLDLDPRAIADGGVDAAAEAARAASGPLSSAGADLVLGPVVDVASSAAAGEEAAFGDDPRTVRRFGEAVARGFREAQIGIAPAHFPGQGAASQDPLMGPAVVGSPREDLLRRDVAPFRALVRRAGAVLVSNAAYVAWDAVTPAAHSSAIVGGLLRKQLRFRGVAIADNVLGATALTGGSAGEAAVAALRAGCDMVHVRDEEERDDVHAELVAALRSGRLPAPRARQAAARVLELKRRLGLLRG